jgi:phosphatidylinositol alpha-mannosyltransferase
VRIALVHPTYWPEVRRGSERLIHDLGVALVTRGHDVTLLTSHGDRPSTDIEDGIRVVRSWRPPQRGPLNWYEHHVANAPNVFWRLARGRYDVAHAFFPVDAWAALAARDHAGGPPVVFSLHGIPTRAFLVKRRYRLEMIGRAVGGAEVAGALSDAAAAAVEWYFGRRPAVLPGGVISERFAVAEARAERPTLVCAASLGDPRKRGGLLLGAFERLRDRRPDARLLCVRPRDPVLSAAVGALPAGAEWVDGDRTADLARLYASSWASVLPAVEEAFGLVLVESLAAGTPAVAARSGACPEILDSESIGRLFEPDDESSLVDALDAALALADRPEIAAACRERAAEYDWGRVVGLYEAAYARALG